MADPNIANTGTLKLDGSSGAITTSAQSVVDNAAASAKSVKIVSLYVTNIHASNSATVTAGRYSAASLGGTSYKIANTLTIPVGTTVVLIDENSPVYVKENQSFGILGSANTTLEWVASYQVINE